MTNTIMKISIFKLSPKLSVSCSQISFYATTLVNFLASCLLKRTIQSFVPTFSVVLFI